MDKFLKISQKNEGGIFFLIISLFIAFLLPNFLGPIVYFLHSVYRFGHTTLCRFSNTTFVIRATLHCEQY